MHGRESASIVNAKLRLHLMDDKISVEDSVAKLTDLQQDEASALYSNSTQLKWLDPKYSPIVELATPGMTHILTFVMTSGIGCRRKRAPGFCAFRAVY